MDNKDEKAVPITYLVVDEKVPDNTEISDAVRKYQKNILFTANKSVVTLSKKNNYYEGKIKNVNKEILKKDYKL